MKRIKILLFTSIAVVSSIAFIQAQTPISPYLLGNNYWIPGATVTELMKPGGLVAQAKIQAIRVGGFGANNYSNTQYLEYIRRIIAMGAKPIVQVRANLTAQQAIDFITLVNVTNKLDVRIWSIGNEPDHAGGGHLSDAQVAEYTIRIAAALKSVDPTILIIGAEYAGYSAGRFANLIGGQNSITGLVPGKDYYYVDIIGHHKYAATGLGDFSGSINDVINKITAENLKRPAGKKLQWCMGEFNSHWNNDDTDNPDMKVYSFNNGQMHAELYGYGMQRGAFTLDSWSVMEGEINRQGTDLSLFDKDLVPRSSYWHSAMLGQNMKANYLTNTDNQTTVSIVAMGDATGTAVMLINKNKTTAYNYTVKLDMTAATANALTVNVNAGINKEVTGNIGAVTTIMLIFDPAGNLTKTITYSKADADIRKAPTTTNGPAVPPVVYNHVLPKKIEAEQFNTNVGLELETTTDVGAGQNIGYTDVADYLEYGIEVPKAGTYSLDFRVASLAGNAGFSVAVDGATVINEVAVAATAGWQTWATINQTIALAAGKHTLRLTITKAGFNFNWMEFKYIPVFYKVPGKIEAENFSNQFGLETETTTDVGAGQNLGYTALGDWAEYDIEVAQSGTYQVDFRVASLNGAAGLSLQVDGNAVGTELLIAATGDWQNWATISQNFPLTAGMHALRFIVTKPGFNINWMDFKQSTVTGMEEYDSNSLFYVSPQPFNSFTILNMGNGNTIKSVNIFNSTWQLIETLQGNNTSQMTVGQNLSAGFYHLLVKTNTGTHSVKIVKQ